MKWGIIDGIDDDIIDDDWWWAGGWWLYCDNSY